MALHVTVLLVIGWHVVVLIDPLVYWRMGSIMWEDPEGHRPSAFALVLHRTYALGFIMVMFYVWIPLWDFGGSQGTRASDEASTFEEETTRPVQPSASLVDLTATSTDGFIAGYVLEDSRTLAIHSRLGACMTPMGSVFANEEEDTVTLTVRYRASESCDDVAEGVGRTRDVVTLAEPLGDREVVDSEGATVRPCDGHCD